MRYDDDDRFMEYKAPSKRKPVSGGARDARYDDARKKPARGDLARSKATVADEYPRAKRPASDSRRPAGQAPGAKRPARPATGSKRPASGAKRRAPDSQRARKPFYDDAGERRRDGYPFAVERPRRAPSGRAYADHDERRVYAKRPKPRRNKRQGGLTFIFVALGIVIAFAISMFLHENVFNIVRLSGDSMYSTINKGDVVVVNKLHKGAISRGDIVAVKLEGKSGYIIRRVVGLPGETISIEEGKTYIDGNLISERYIGLESYDSFETVTLPTGKYYVLCDNRSELSDSRAKDISMVDASQIDGQADFRIWPMDRFGKVR